MCDNERDALDLHFYASDPAREELEIEYWSRYDYQAELRREHEESPENLASEAEARAAEWQAEQDAFIGPRQPVRRWWHADRPDDDEIPF